MRIKLDPSKKRLVKTLSWIILTSFAILYIMIHLLRGFSPRLVTGNTVLATEELYSVFDAYIMRNEKVLYSSNTGYCDYMIGDGAYSKTESELARVYAIYDGDVEKRIREIDARIALLEKSAIRLNTVGILGTRDEIDYIHASIMEDLAATELTELPYLTGELLRNMYKLKHNTGGNAETLVAASNEELAALISERAELISSLGAYESIVSSGVGNFFYGVDGYEAAYSSENISEMELSDFYTMFDSERKTEQNAVGCYVPDIVWYVAIPTDMKTSVTYTEGNTYSVGFDYTSRHRFDMTLERIVRDDSDTRAVMLFSCNKMPSDLDRTRFQKVRILNEKHSGYRIPNNAILEKNGQTGVYILNEGKVAWRRIDVLYDNGLYSIVRSQPSLAENHDYSMISLNDTYIVSHKGLYEGKLID